MWLEVGAEAGGREVIQGACVKSLHDFTVLRCWLLLSRLPGGNKTFKRVLWPLAKENKHAKNRGNENLQGLVGQLA